MGNKWNKKQQQEQQGRRNKVWWKTVLTNHRCLCETVAEPKEEQKGILQKGSEAETGRNRWFNSLSPWRASGLLKILLGMPEKPRELGQRVRTSNSDPLKQWSFRWNSNKTRFRFQVNYERRIISKQCPGRTKRSSRRLRGSLIGVPFGVDT